MVREHVLLGGRRPPAVPSGLPWSVPGVRRRSHGRPVRLRRRRSSTTAGPLSTNSASPDPPECLRPSECHGRVSRHETLRWHETLGWGGRECRGCSAGSLEQPEFRPGDQRWPFPRRRSRSRRVVAVAPAPGSSTPPPAASARAAERRRPRTRCARRAAGTRTASRSTSPDVIASMLPIAVDAMGGDDAPDVVLAGVRRAVDDGIPVVLVGPSDLAHDADIELISRQRADRHGRGAGRGRAHEEGLDARSRCRGGSRRNGVGDGLGRQHRGDDGGGTVADGPDQGGQASGHRHADPGARRGDSDRAPRRRRQRRGAARVARAVRPDGQRVRPHSIPHRRATCRPAVDRRGAGQGRLPPQGGVSRCCRRPARSTSSATSRAAT